MDREALQGVAQARSRLCPGHDHPKEDSLTVNAASMSLIAFDFHVCIYVFYIVFCDIFLSCGIISKSGLCGKKTGVNVSTFSFKTLTYLRLNFIDSQLELFI